MANSDLLCIYISRSNMEAYLVPPTIFEFHTSSVSLSFHWYLELLTRDSRYDILQMRITTQT